MPRRTTAIFAGVIAAAAAFGWFAHSRAESIDRQLGTVRAAPIVGDIAADTFRTIATAQMPMVVSLRTLSEAGQPRQQVPPELRRFFGLPEFGLPDEGLREGAGTGFVIDRSGLILTNNHVVEDATRIEVSFFPRPDSNPADVQRLEARVLGRDPITDSALLQVEGARNLPVATLGNSDDMRPGDWVMAIGNPFALSHTVTVGVISAHARPFPVEGRVQRVLQTDAAVNPGNSGGPLINLRGEVIGVNTAIISPGGTGNIGIGFAVPINVVQSLVPQLRTGDVERGRLGVGIGPVSTATAKALGLADGRGALIATVEPDGPAARAGLEPGDVILAYRGEPIDDADELVSLVSSTAPGTDVRLDIQRADARRSVTVTIGRLSVTERESAAQSDTASAAGLGIVLSPLTARAAQQLGLPSGQAGALVSEVARGSAAADAGLQPGDVIVQVNRQPVRSAEDAASRVRQTASGQAVLLLVVRRGQEVFLAITAP